LVSGKGFGKGVVVVKTYEITAERSDGWWAFSVPEIQGAHGQAKRLDQVRDAARDVVSKVADVPADSFELELNIRLEPHVEHLLSEAKEMRDQVEKLQQAAQDTMRRAIEQCKDVAGLSVRDIGNLLDVSFQRVSQVLGETKKVVSEKRKKKVA
jgi:DNA-directed RNA polymerase specialized sigma24 family protein